MKFLVIGEVYTDVHLQAKIEEKNIVRLGGIFHSARALHAHKIDYSLAYISPSYLSNSISYWAAHLCATSYHQVGEILDCPNVIFIADSVEAGDQGYNDILKDQHRVELSLDALRNVIQTELPTDIILYPGKFPLDVVVQIIREFSCRFHIDCQYGKDQILELLDIESGIETFIISTSSSYFNEDCLGEIQRVSPLVDSGKVKSILLKENRGGSRYYKDSVWVGAPAYPVETAHSVGVGDCFNVVFLSNYYRGNAVNSSLRLASYSSAWYASTWRHEEFCSLIDNLPSVSEIMELKGNQLHWEERKLQHIYIAAPDFPDIDVSWIEKLYDALQYHNFTPHRPVRENGLIRGDEPDSQQLESYHNDLLLLNQCSILIAVLLNDDPGTYVEIGWMAAKGKPAILFDPTKSARNLFLRKTANRICYTLGEVIDAVYEYTSSKIEGAITNV
ncbi:nucleoside 2-deoxyribosyltransferase [Cohnella nanjingensis]|uniref:Nucleoside 2-deoxyribosyltransferase n=1 Tax=Cohnella nanjingensis TaxID=1387779 RepID=A0A7X0RM71_9BACL|nr:nucleoside 2-deoxyribosyltransferase [Cohnella nanjingensis]